MKTATTQSCLIDSVHLGEVAIDNITDPNSVRLSAKLALVHGEDGQRMGFMNKAAWSDETWQLLRDLIDSMERDALREVFGEAATDGGDLPLTATSGGVPGL